MKTFIFLLLACASSAFGEVGALLIDSTSGQVNKPNITVTGSVGAGSMSTHSLVASATGTEDSPVVGLSETGASAGFFSQGVNFASPAVTIRRTGTAGCAPASTALLFLQTGAESTGTCVTLLIGGCTVTGGDNYILCFADSSIACRGGIREYMNNKVQGPVTIDPTYMQLLDQYGNIAVSWGGGGVTLRNLSASSLPGYPSDGTKILYGNGTWSVPTLPGVTVSAAPTTVTASHGTFTWSMPFQGPGYKKMLVYFNGFTGTLTTTFPTVFTYPPLATGPCASSCSSITTTGYYCAGTSLTGWLILEGF